MGVTWKGGRRPQDGVPIALKHQRDAIVAGALEILEEVIEQAGAETQDYLEQATTKTGYARAQATGGSPGRHDTGNMIASVSHEIRDRSKTAATGVFGWWGSNYEQYFKDQDQGEGNIPAARALPTAQMKARETFRARIAKLMRTGSVSD